MDLNNIKDKDGLKSLKAFNKFLINLLKNEHKNSKFILMFDKYNEDISLRIIN